MPPQGNRHMGSNTVGVVVGGCAIVAQLIQWVAWGSKLDDRTTTNAAAIEQLQSKREPQVVHDATQDASIQVIIAKFENLQKSVDKIADKVGAR